MQHLVVCVCLFQTAKTKYFIHNSQKSKWRKPGETGATSITALLCLIRSDEWLKQAAGSSALSQLSVTYCRTFSFWSLSSDVLLFGVQLSVTNVAFCLQHVFFSASHPIGCFKWKTYKIFIIIRAIHKYKTQLSYCEWNTIVSLKLREMLSCYSFRQKKYNRPKCFIMDLLKLVLNVVQWWCISDNGTKCSLWLHLRENTCTASLRTITSGRNSLFAVIHMQMQTYPLQERPSLQSPLSWVLQLCVCVCTRV